MRMNRTASRYYKVRPQDVTPTSDQQAMSGMADSYIVTVSVAGRSHPVNCSVNENGAVSESSGRLEIALVAVHSRTP